MPILAGDLSVASFSSILRLCECAMFKLPPQFGQCSMSMSKTRLSSLAQLRRAGAPCA